MKKSVPIGTLFFIWMLPDYFLSCEEKQFLSALTYLAIALCVLI